MCDRCRQFSDIVELANREQLETLQVRLYDDGLKPGRLEVIDGTFQWADVVECTLRCASCGQRFQLSCETYHGVGGRFEPVSE